MQRSGLSERAWRSCELVQTSSRVSYLEPSSAVTDSRLRTSSSGQKSAWSTRSTAHLFSMSVIDLSRDLVEMRAVRVFGAGERSHTEARPRPLCGALCEWSARHQRHIVGPLQKFRTLQIFSRPKRSCAVTRRVSQEFEKKVWFSLLVVEGHGALR